MRLAETDVAASWRLSFLGVFDQMKGKSFLDSAFGEFLLWPIWDKKAHNWKDFAAENLPKTVDKGNKRAYTKITSKKRYSQEQTRWKTVTQSYRG